MKRTKQAAAALTALALAASMALPVWAEDTITNTTATNTDGSRSATCEVKAVYKPEEVIHFDIEWSDMSFTYTPGKWTVDETGNNDVLGYNKEGDSAVGWNNKKDGDNGNGQTNKTSRYIKLTNKSNTNVAVNFGFTAIEGETDRIKAEFYVNNDKIDEKGVWMERADANVDGLGVNSGATAGAQGTEKKGVASEAMIDFYLIGRPKHKYESETKIGDITITLKAVSEDEPSQGTYAKIYKQKTSQQTAG